FQAEDGIRDRNVTGVQTCALPIFESVRDKVPPEVFTTVYRNPVNGNADAVRANLREATRLLKEAGYEIRDRRLTNVKTGEPFTRSEERRVGKRGMSGGGRVIENKR